MKVSRSSSLSAHMRWLAALRPAQIAIGPAARVAPLGEDCPVHRTTEARHLALLAELHVVEQRPPELVDVLEEDSEDAITEDVQSRALEFVKDRAAKLDWEQMQRLVAGLLRAMGYKTRVSPAGPDRGKDIIASPDGLGFESPRIVVEVKHRQGAMGSQEIRSFLGGRHKDDKGIYVSTGGFTKDVSTGRYELSGRRLRHRMDR
jgi:restriction endonuclease Mrr